MNRESYLKVMVFIFEKNKKTENEGDNMRKKIFAAIIVGSMLFFSICALNSEVSASSCGASLDYKFTLVVPVIDYSGTLLSAELQYSPSTDGEVWFYVTNVALTGQSCSSPAVFALHNDGNFKLYMPVVMVQGTSLWVYLQFDALKSVTDPSGRLWLKLSSVGLN